MKRMGLLLAMSCLAFYLFGCGEDGGKEVKNNTCGTFNDLVGVWESPGEAEIIFEADSNYAIFSGGELSSGTFSVDDCKFILEEGEDGGACLGVEGIYKYNISYDRDAMNVQLVSDDCEMRAQVLQDIDFNLQE